MPCKHAYFEKSTSAQQRKRRHSAAQLQISCDRSFCTACQREAIDSRQTHAHQQHELRGGAAGGAAFMTMCSRAGCAACALCTSAHRYSNVSAQQAIGSLVTWKCNASLIAAILQTKISFETRMRQASRAHHAPSMPSFVFALVSQ